ncbi:MULTISPECIES: TetR/AcrR family transcriptional regulator [unclassified Nocardia]|uniref:TetR/AcrR family transcriptional regulator n=1 Tax=unclassified Nocardia TaxID=2637762 RepID=UPI0033A59619
MSPRRTQILEAAVRVIAAHGVRGLRVEQLAAEAGVSTALIYYHFKDRGGVLRAALEHINHRAQDYTDQALAAAEDPRAQLEHLLLLELQDVDEVRMNSIAWGELRASAVFDPDLRTPLTATTRAWNADVETLLTEAGATAPALAAEHLTALVEGLSERWHTGSITLDRARAILTHAIERELAA